MKNIEEYIARKSPSSVIVLTDTHTAVHCLPIFSKTFSLPFSHINIPAGENFKNADQAIAIWNRMLDLHADRKALLVNLGGGMITDIGGFCAATFKRGISFINVPTTLLAMVDAAIGGKTGINLGHFKNQAGVFAAADEVFIDPVFLKTLPERELKAGYAEVLKYGLIDDKPLWDHLKNISPAQISDWEPVIQTCAGIKHKIILQDPKEAGLRKILNFGHTIGHALESYSLDHDANPCLHGEAVAAGMVAEAWLSTQKTNLPQEALNEITTSILALFPKYQVPPQAYPDLIRYMSADKKNDGGQINFVLLSGIGNAVYDIYCTTQDIAGALDYYFSL